MRCRETSGGAVSGRPSSTASASWRTADSASASISAFRLANRRCTVVRATPAASAICSMDAPGSAASTRSAASRITRTLRSASARSRRTAGSAMGTS